MVGGFKGVKSPADACYAAHLGSIHAGVPRDDKDNYAAGRGGG